MSRPSEAVVLDRLLARCQSPRLWVEMPSIADLARDCSLGTADVRAALSRLANAGAIEVQRRLYPHVRHGIGRYLYRPPPPPQADGLTRHRRKKGLL